MYVILVYDVKIERINKVRNLARQYLNWIQNSVFEGELTKGQLRILKHEIKKIINEEEDSVIIYALTCEKEPERIIIGKEKGTLDDYL